MCHASSSGSTRRALLNVCIAMMLCGVLLAWTQAAQAHAALVGSDPIEGAVLDRAPAAVSLVFNEPVGPLAFKLFTPDGGTLDPGPVQSIDDLVSIMLPPAAPQGAYLLSWRVVSGDGHPVAGVLSYAVGVAGPAQQPQAVASNPLRDAAIWASRLLLYLCLIASVGAALFRAAAPRRPQETSRSTSQDWARRVIPAGLALLLISLALQGLDALDRPWTGLAHADTWRAAFDSRYAGTLGLAAMALAAAYRALDSDRVWVQRTAAIGSVLLLAAALANSGHASTAPPQWLARPAVALHIITVTAWLGALIPLARMLRAHTAAQPDAVALPDALGRFSHWITPIVGVMLLSGAALVWLQLGNVSDLWRTPYGRILAAKLALVAVLLLAAAVNRYRYTRPVLAGEPRARHGLLRMIGFEIVLAACILGLVSLWRFTPPPRSVHAAQATAQQSEGRSISTRIVLRGPSAQATIRYQAGSGMSGVPTTLLIALSGQGAAGVMDAEAVTVTLSNPQADIESLRREARQLGDGSWETTIPPLPGIAGWRVRLDVRVDDFTQFTLEGDMADAAR
jgi:copper transport protein